MRTSAPLSSGSTDRANRPSSRRPPERCGGSGTRATSSKVYWLERALEQADPASADACEIACGLAHIAWRQGDWPASNAWANQAIAKAELLGDLGTAAFVYGTRATVVYFSGDKRASVEDFERSARLARETGNKRLIATCVTNLGILAIEERRLADAKPLIHEALDAARVAGSLDLEANAIATLADLRLAEGDLDEARALAYRALAMQYDLEASEIVLTESLVRISALVVDEDARLACLLIGARDAWAAQSGTVIEPFSVNQRTRALETAQKKLGAAGTVEALASSGDMSVSEAVDLALGSVKPRESA